MSHSVTIVAGDCKKPWGGWAAGRSLASSSGGSTETKIRKVAALLDQTEIGNTLADLRVETMPKSFLDWRSVSQIEAEPAARFGMASVSGAGQSCAILVSGRGPPPAALSRRPQLPSARSRSTTTATLPSVPAPAFSDCSPALIASTVLSMVRPICGITSPCTAHSIARPRPRWRKAFASPSSVAGSEK